MQDLYLAHHGIKGMKWGVRRYQNPDGTLTDEGKKRYAEDGNGGYKKLTRYERAYAKYKAIGYDDKKAAQAAKGKVATERALAIIGGVTVAAVTAYAGYRIMDTNRDRFISPDKVMQTVHKGDISERIKPGNPFYATYDKKDNTIYASRVFSHFGEDSSVTKFYTKDGIKVASEKTGRKIFEELRAKDPEIAEYAKRVRAGGTGSKAYQMFNYSLVLRNDSDTAKQMGLADLDHDKIHKRFYDELRKRGYGAVIDTNDSKREGFTFNPVIVFDNQIKHVVSSAKASPEDLGTKRMAKGAAYATARKTLLHPVSDPTAAAAGVYFLGMLGLTSASTASASRDLNARANYVERYRQEHPNTELTNAEIAKMYKGGK